MEVVPFSGIQIIDFEIDLSDVDRPLKRFGIKDDVLYPLAFNDNYDGYQSQFSENYSSVIDQFQEEWLPAPVFRSAGTGNFDEGPSTWARMRTKIKSKSDKGDPIKVICQIALDTSIDLENDPKLSGDDYYLMPSQSDVLFEKEFEFVSSPPQMDWFLDSEIDEDGEWIETQKWVAEWITDVLQRNGVNKTQTELNRVWAKYFTMVEVFSLAKIPTFKLLDTLSDNNKYSPIETDFVLDLGNSRTCGILLEKPDNQDLKIETAIPFKIRDFENAEVYKEGLMESRVELAQANFGREDLAKQTGRMEAFLWPSPVRVGSEAQSIQVRSKGADTASGLSSAKRYLWDQSPVEREWRFADTVHLPTIAIQTRQLLNDAGNLRSDDEPPTRDLKFSRSSFMMFMIAELIAHAFAQINNPKERGSRPNPTIPRRLSKIILTIPTATPSREQSILKRRALEALDYVWKMLELPPNNKIYKKPELVIDWDEASCSQQVFLFNEISEIYSHKAQEYFRDYGKERNIQGEKRDSLRIASIDIGGGTTDLMVTTYYCDRKDVIYPIQEFREGFRIAGDDILYGLIKEAILPGIATHLSSLGANNAEMAVANFFQAVDDTQTNLKANFANSILVPSAIKILENFENQENTLVKIKISDPSKYNEKVFESSLEKMAVSAGLTEWPKKDISITISQQQFKTVIDNVLSKISTNIATALHNYSCDYVLLTGRPSKLAYVRELFEEKSILGAHRLISLHDYPVGSWYPFREPLSGRIGDPKSTVVVGALLNSVSSFELTNYSFKSEQLNLKSTSNFIGEMETSGQIRQSKIIIDNINQQNTDEFTYEFTNPVHFGARQINDENWTTSPLYRLSVPSGGLGSFKLPLSVTLRRISDAFYDDGMLPDYAKEAKKEEVEITEITDSEGRFAPIETLKLNFNTLGKVDNYWLETGIFT